MKRLFVLILVFLLLPVTALAHSGKTDGNGGHWDHSNDEYHYHHGYPAHDHYDMDGDGDIDCPYRIYKDDAEENSDPIVLPPIPEFPSYSFPVLTTPEYSPGKPSNNQPTTQEESASDILILPVSLCFFAFCGWCIWYGRRSNDSE